MGGDNPFHLHHRNRSLSAPTGGDRNHTGPTGFFGPEHGVTAIEYGLIAALISVAIMTVLATLGEAVMRLFEALADIIDILI